jgi:hypothetical protein
VFLLFTTASAEFVFNGIMSPKELRCSVYGFFCLYAIDESDESARCPADCNKLVVVDPDNF